MSKMQTSFAGRVLINFGLLFILNIIECHCVAAQTNLKELFPAAFEYLDIGGYLNLDPVNDLLELSIEQREIAREIDKRHEVEYMRVCQMPDFKTARLALSRRVYAEYSAMLSDQQSAKLDQIMVTRFYQQEAIRNASIIPVRNDFAGMLLVPTVIEFLKIEDLQQLRIKDANELICKSYEKAEKAKEQSVLGIFERWQRALLAELLDFQRRDFENATGKTFEFPGMIQQMQSKAGFGGPKFLQVDFNTHNRYTTSPTAEITMLLQTPFYLDAHMQPNGMFALLLSDESIKELKITADQQKRLEKVKTSWDQKHPLPTELTVDLKFGSNMSSKKQREDSTVANRTYAAIENQVFEILTANQRERLRQIWNQLVLSMGWSGVSLTFPDWRDYLELSDEQRKAFDRIHDEFRSEIRKLAEKFDADEGNFAQDYRKSIAEALNKEQIEKLNHVLGVQLEDQSPER